MVLSLGVIPRAAFIASQIGLDPEKHPGTVEIIDGIQRIFFASQKHGMSSDNFRDGMNSAADYWKFQVGVVHDFADDVIITEDFDPIIGALIGGIDAALIPSRAPDIFWKTAAAKQATFIALQSSNIHTPQGFAASRIDVKYAIMADTYCDLCAQAALLDAYPERFKSTPAGDLGGVGVADRLGIFDCRLTCAIRDAESSVLRKWRSVYVPPAAEAGKPTLKIVQ